MKIDPTALGGAIKAVLHAAKSATEERFSYIWLEAGPRETFIRVIATDNYRIAVHSVPFGDGQDATNYALAVTDANAIMHFLARASYPMQLVTWEQNTRVAFRDPYSALIVLNHIERHPMPDWHKMAEMKFENEIFANLQLFAEAAAAVGGSGYMQSSPDPAKPFVFLGENHAEYVMPLRTPKVTDAPKEPEFKA